MVRGIMAAGLVVLVAGCAVQQMPMPYVATVSVQQDTANKQKVRVDRVTDERNEKDPTWIGAIRGGLGNPLKVLHSDAPVEQIVTRAFTDGLKARGLHASNQSASNLMLSVTVHKFEAIQVVRRGAEANFSITLTNPANGQVMWRDRHHADKVNGSIIALTGVFANPEELQKLMARAMNETIDALLDKPEFRAALR